MPASGSRSRCTESRSARVAKDVRTALYVSALTLGAVFLASSLVVPAIFCVLVCLALLARACIIDVDHQRS